jgi:hypothetical protein
VDKAALLADFSKYWEDKASEWPDLYRLASVAVIAPIASTAPERANSIMRKVGSADDRRARKDRSFSTAIFLSVNRYILELVRALALSRLRAAKAEAVAAVDAEARKVDKVSAAKAAAAPAQRAIKSRREAAKAAAGAGAGAVGGAVKEGEGGEGGKGGKEEGEEAAQSGVECLLHWQLSGALSGRDF